MVFYNGVLPKTDRMAKLAGKQLVNTNSFVYLGFTFTTRLKFSEHGKNLCHKANARIGTLFHKLHLHNLPFNLLVDVFSVYILPIFLYGLFIWFPQSSDSTKIW